MFDIYLENYLDSTTGQIESGPVLALSIPTSDPTSIWMLSPSFKAEVGKAESFDFSVNPGSPFYSSFVQYKTMIRVVYDGLVICYSRVTTVNTSGLLQVRAIHSEGLYSILKDSQIEGVEEELQEKISASTLLNNILSEHNSRISGEPWKEIIRGVTDSGLDNGELKKIAPTSWTDALAAIDSILSKYGGYTRVRYEHPNGNPAGKITSYLDWKKDYFNDAGANRPHIQVAKNLIDFSTSSEISELFTRVIPVGQKTSTTKKKESKFVYLSGQKYYSVSRVCNDGYTDAELNSGFHRKSDYANAEANYGIIYKTVNFSNANTEAKLHEYVRDWVKKNYYGALRTFSVKAIDMHMLGDNDPKILVGDCIDFTYPEYTSDGQTVLITRKLLCKAVSYNLFNPEKSSYTLGIPSDLLDFEYGEKKKTTKSSSTTAGAAKAVSGGGKTEPKVVTWRNVLHFLLWYYYSRDYSDGLTIPRYRTVDGVPVEIPEEDRLIIKRQMATDNAKSHYAYSWKRSGGFTGNGDKTPYATFKANGEYKTVDASGEPQYVYKYFSNIYWQEGTERPKFRIMGHYRIDGCSEYPNGFEYGIAYNEDSENDDDPDIYTFAWAHINREEPFTIFRFRDFWSGAKGGSSAESGGADVGSEFASSQGGAVTDEDTKATVWYDESGKPSAAIFPDLGTAGFGDAKHWVNDQGEEVPPGTEGAHEEPIIDPQTGLPVWSIKLNTPITYIDPRTNQRVTKEGCIVANDLGLGDIPSFITELGVMQEAIIERATIGELRAYTAILGSGEATPLHDDPNNPDKITGYSVEGTQFETNANAMVGVSGLFETDAHGHIQKDSEGNAIIKEGGGLSVRRNNVVLGLYDEGNLTGGLMVKKINKQTTTTLRGDVINLDTGVDDEGNATGHIKLTDVMTIRAAGGTTIKSDTYFDGDIYLSSGSSGGRSWSGNISASNAVIRNKIIFSDPDISDINNAPALTLSKMGKSHVKVVDGDSENTYVLKYLPAYLDPDTASEAEWIVSGNFNRAASGGAITASWSGSSPRNNLIIADESHAYEYVINFGNSRQISGKTINDIIEVINIDDNGDEYENTVSTASYSNGKYLVVPYRIVKTTPSTGAEDDSYTTIFNGTLGSVNATPVYNNGWNAASDITALNPVIVSSQTTKDFRLIKPKKNDPGNSQTVGYYVDVDINYAYVKDPNDSVIAKVDNAAADRNRSSRIGNNVPNYYNVNDDEYDNAPNDHKFALTRYSSRYSVVTQYQKRDGTYANGDTYYVTTPADRYNDGKNDIIDAGGPISQNGAVSNRAINKYVTTLTVTGINATGNISITNRQNVSNTAGLSALATALGASGQNQLSNMFQTDPGSYNQYYGIKVECPSASNTPQYYYFKTPADRYDSGRTDGFNSVSGSNVDLRDITKTNGIRGNVYIQRSGGNWVNARSFSISMPANSSASWTRALKNASTYVYSCTVAGTTYTHEWSKGS